MRIPQIRPHSSGNYRVTINGKTHYLGRDKAAAERRYRELMAEEFSSGSRTTLPMSSVTVSELLKLFRESQQQICSPRWWEKKDQQLLQMERPVLELYADLDVTAFNPRCFHAIRAKYAEKKKERSRGYVNELSRKLKQAFKWGAERELVPVELLVKLQAIPELRPRELGLQDNEEVEDVKWEKVEATLPYLSDRNADIILLLWETAMRPEELLMMKVGEVKSNLHQLKNHKTDRYNKRRVIPFNEKAWAILERRQKGKKPGERIFNWLGDSHALYQAVQRACIAGMIEPWFPYQLRHAAVTRIAIEHGKDVASAIAGHSSALTTDRYDHGAMERVRRAVG